MCIIIIIIYMCNTWGQSSVAIKKHHIERTSRLVVLSRSIAKRYQNLRTNLRQHLSGLWASLNSSVTLTVLGHPRVGGSAHHAARSNSCLRFTPFLASWAKASVFFASFFPRKKKMFKKAIYNLKQSLEMKRNGIQNLSNITLAWKCCLGGETPHLLLCQF